MYLFFNIFSLCVKPETGFGTHLAERERSLVDTLHINKAHARDNYKKIFHRSIVFSMRGFFVAVSLRNKRNRRYENTQFFFIPVCPEGVRALLNISGNMPERSTKALFAYNIMPDRSAGVLLVNNVMPDCSAEELLVNNMMPDYSAGVLLPNHTMPHCSEPVLHTNNAMPGRPEAGWFAYNTMPKGAIGKQLLQIVFNADLLSFQNLIGLYETVKSVLTPLPVDNSKGALYASFYLHTCNNQPIHTNHLNFMNDEN